MVIRTYQADVLSFHAKENVYKANEDSGHCDGPRPRKTPRLSRNSPEMPKSIDASTVHSMDLEEIGPALMYGPLISFLKAALRALAVVTIAVIPPWVIAVWILGGALVFVLFPAFFVGTTLVSAVVISVVEICWHHWLLGVKRELEPHRFLAERMEPPNSPWDVFLRTVDAIDESRKYAQEHGVGRSADKWLEDWFLGAPIATIRKENVAEWFAWAFWTKKLDEMAGDDVFVLSRMLQEAKHRFGWGMQEGYNASIKCIRISFDKLESSFHPFLYYSGVRILHLATRQSMRLLGFSHYSSPGRSPAYFHKPPLREDGVLVVDGSEQRAQQLPPVVFLHGVGVGLSPYLPFIRRLARERECFVVEIAPIAQCCEKDVLTPPEMVEAIETMLKTHGHTSAVFMAHSFGTCIMSWLCRMKSPLVSQAVFIDPVCFGLCHPDVAYNFLYRSPPDAFMLVAAHFIRWELFTANVLYRNFYWYHNTLWTDELPEGSVVALSGADSIIDARLVRLHLEAHQRRQGAAASEAVSPSTTATASQSKGMKMLWFDRFLHGSFLVSKPAQLQIISLLHQSH